MGSDVATSIDERTTRDAIQCQTGVIDCSQQCVRVYLLCFRYPDTVLCGWGQRDLWFVPPTPSIGPNVFWVPAALCTCYSTIVAVCDPPFYNSSVTEPLVAEWVLALQKWFMFNHQRSQKVNFVVENPVLTQDARCRHSCGRHVSRVGVRHVLHRKVTRNVPAQTGVVSSLLALRR